MTAPIVEVSELEKTYVRGGLRHSVNRAVSGLSFTVNPGESLGLVGESGSGKTTTGRIVCGLERPSGGRVRVADFDLMSTRRTPARLYDTVQMVFQDPYLSLNPRMSVLASIEYALRVRRIAPAERQARVREVLSHVGLSLAIAERYPHELSTGQRQRAGIARAIISRPQLIVADEPVSSLDVSLQAQILNLLSDIQRETGVSYLFISHDLAAVRYLCDRVVVMRAGICVEQGSVEQIMVRPQSDYTLRLVRAAGLAAGNSATGESKLE